MVLPDLAALAADATGIPFAEVLAEKGTLGVVILILLVVIRQLDKRERDSRESLAAKVEALQAARLEDAKLYRDGVIAATGRVYEAVRDLNEVMERIERSGR